VFFLYTARFFYFDRRLFQAFVVPLVGGVYEKFGLQIGYELLESGLITQLNQQATSNASILLLTSAYYYGNVIGITFYSES
jgi:hypothetical protein